MPLELGIAEKVSVRGAGHGPNNSHQDGWEIDPGIALISVCQEEGAPKSQIRLKCQDFWVS